MPNQNISSKAVINPISIDFGIADSEQVSARTRQQNNLEDIAVEFGKSGRVRQDSSERPLLIVREIELPKLIRNMVAAQSQDGKLLERRKQISNSPGKKRLGKDALLDCPSFLVGTDKQTTTPH